ncbi:unnamed protein product [Rhizopus stolonifer]
MSQSPQDYFTLTHEKPKGGLFNRRQQQQQQQANYLQPLELPSLPPLSQLLPTDQVKTTEENQISFTQPQMMYDYSTTAEQYPLGDPHLNQNPELVAAAVSMMNFDSMYIPPVVSQPSDMTEYNRTRQASNASHSSTEKIYSFVEIPGTNQKKRPRRRYDEIERLYHCNWPACTKAYGTLNHLNAHVSMQKHGPKRNPAEFKEMRKEWRKQKKDRENQKKNEQKMMNYPLSNFNQIPADTMSLNTLY